jgi:hypothetical protein
MVVHQAVVCQVLVCQVDFQEVPVVHIQVLVAVLVQQSK